MRSKGGEILPVFKSPVISTRRLHGLLLVTNPGSPSLYVLLSKGGIRVYLGGRVLMPNPVMYFAVCSSPG